MNAGEEKRGMRKHPGSGVGLDYITDELPREVRVRAGRLR